MTILLRTHAPCLQSRLEGQTLSQATIAAMVMSGPCDGVGHVSLLEDDDSTSDRLACMKNSEQRFEVW